MFKNSIIMLNGLPMSGKSTFGRLIAKKLKNSVILKSSELRNQEKVPEKITVDESDSELRLEKDMVYKKMAELGEEAVKNNRVPILDATFHLKRRREVIYNLSKKNIKIYLIELIRPDEEIDGALEQRKKLKRFDNVLNTRENYDIMKSQTETITQEEFENFNFSWVKINISIKKADFFGEWKEEEKEVILKLIKDEKRANP